MMQLLQGDCLEHLRGLPSSSIDMVLTDPPYANTAQAWDKMLNWGAIWPELKRVCKENAAKLFFACNGFTIDLCASNRKEYRYRYQWVKPVATNVFNSKRMPLRQCEEVCVFYQRQPTYNPQMRQGQSYNHRPLICRKSIYGEINLADLFHKIDVNQLSERSRQNLAAALAEHGLTIEAAAQLSSAQLSSVALNIRPGVTGISTRYPTDVLKCKPVHTTAQERLHSNQKPVPLLEQLIKTYTNEGETVLDFTMGSGSCGIACLNTGRNFVGIELDAEIFAKAQARIKQHKEQGGKYNHS